VIQVPTYEYRCPNGHEFEEFFRTISSAASELKCPTCGEIAARQLSGGGGLVFKGSGFYITDYGKDGKKNQPAAPSRDASPDTTSGGETAKGSASEKKTSSSESKAPGKKSE
jgi:putative FmdB family regulatory protein